ncbi:MAG: carbamoyltransferase HypF [Thermodesulfovibrionales bacterium]|nr:carbamoyltransferase HypF [Thermodesulfovibrionales bacterium]
MNRVLISIKGVVQGVGFRPFVYNLAKSLNLKGTVTNTADSVAIDIEGDDITSFIDRLPREAPPLSEIRNIDVSPMPFCGYEDFEILKSSDSGSFTLISPDVSVCDDCIKEMTDKDNRCYLYPFINCVNCGPRYTITKAVPYDRQNTTMSVFEMCDECKSEYNNPADRRFHAQPNACPECGPHLELKIQNSKFKIYEKENPIESAINILKQGGIVAIKGLGGFHIACDAANKDAVERLRERKRKSNKPFALMAPDAETIRKYCGMRLEEEELLTSNKRPIVLLRKKTIKDNLAPLPESISPNNLHIGFMLPYTPLHYLLFYYPAFQSQSLTPNPQSPNFDALIMTSGNLSEEPIVVSNNEAEAKFPDIVDAFLTHNRDIFMRVDDSVVRNHFIGHRTKPLFIRRSRGYAPEPILLDDDGPEVLGCGADLKNTFTLTKGSYAIPSQHIGDMENYETVKFFEESLENLKKVYRVNPVAVGYDLHLNYLSTKWALAQQSETKNPSLVTRHSSLSFYGIQHHYAHIASVMAENGIKRKVIGVAFDGTGYGTDGNLWGSEFLIAGIDGFKRAGHFKYIPLPGGETAIREPWRVAVSYIKYITGADAAHYLESIAFVKKYGSEKINAILRIIDNRDFSPLSSSAGRLFDAVSAMLGICDINTFEGEAAMALESYTISGIEEDYPADIGLKDRIEIDFCLALFRLIQDMAKGVGKDIIATKFHNTIVTIITGVVQRLGMVHKLHDVVLSGGVFQNMYLLENTVDRLKSIGMNIYTNEKVPANDAGISLGQAYIVRERMKQLSRTGKT